ncbi:outer membrane beta-barrel protein [uncultured Methylobacterium sp.]|jgi:opacity protein-like surface antigen|uniref:outer membrane protein n=1 Tax=uncultured Methylobacterium sp. TaxID=157278 RepID=UPI0026392228|nr:outer membrane beta-barrel protein [uncultured Methylobacterium sp.]
MARFRHSLTAALIGWTLAAAPGSAADLLPLPPPPPLPAPEPVDIGTGWYLRGDFTASDFLKPKDDTLPGTPGAPLTGFRLSSTEGFGGGIGYRFNSFLRADVTADTRSRSRFRDYSSRTNFTEGYNTEAGKLDVTTALFNVYADLGTWWGLTPYVGAGVGVAWKRFHDNWTGTTCLTAECGSGAPTYALGFQGFDTRANHSSTSLAWAAMAGLSYELGAGLSLDASYRYLEIGKARTGFDVYQQNTRIKDIRANEFRIGLRWAFGPLPFGGFGGDPGIY